MFSFEGKTGDLKRALNTVGNVIAKNGTVPILANVLIEHSKDGKFHLSGTNIDIAMSNEVEGSGSGSITIPHAKLSSFVNVSDHETIKIEQKGEEQSVKCTAGDATCKIPTLPVEDMPVQVMHDIDCNEFFIPCDRLKDILRAMQFACKSEKSRAYLMGAYFDTVNGAVVATDGKIMAVDYVDMSDAVQPFILPANAIDAVIKLCDHGECVVRANNAAATFRTNIGFLRTKVIDGKFPDYTRLLQSQERVIGSLSIDELVRVVQQGSIAADPMTQGCLVSFGEYGFSVERKGSDGDYSQSKGWADVKNSMEFGMLPSYLTWAANSFNSDAEHVEIMCDGNNYPVFMRAVNDKNSLRLLMPMRI